MLWRRAWQSAWDLPGHHSLSPLLRLFTHFLESFFSIPMIHCCLKLEWIRWCYGNSMKFSQVITTVIHCMQVHIGWPLQLVFTLGPGLKAGHWECRAMLRPREREWPIIPWLQRACFASGVFIRLTYVCPKPVMWPSMMATRWGLGNCEER